MPMLCWKNFHPSQKHGEIEGLTADQTSNELLVLFNRGARIVLGMGKGLYPGYYRS